MHSPQAAHVDVVYRTLHYFHGSCRRGVWMYKKGQYFITAYIDANWAGSTVDIQPTIGFCSYIRGNLVT